MNKSAILIGNSSGIGKEVTTRLLELGYKVLGISKSPLSIDHTEYRHITLDVRSSDFRDKFSEILASLPTLDLCVYFAGIGNALNWSDLRGQTEVMEVNLMAAVVATELALGKMVTQDSGHFIGLSSVADQLVSAEALGYCASKAGISRYWEGLGLGMKSKTVKVSNIRFGFVDTKLAKAPVRPFLMNVRQAGDFVLKVIDKPRIRATKPWCIVPLVWAVSLPSRILLLFK